MSRHSKYSPQATCKRERELTFLSFVAHCFLFAKHFCHTPSFRVLRLIKKEGLAFSTAQHRRTAGNVRHLMNPKDTLSDTGAAD